MFTCRDCSAMFKADTPRCPSCGSSSVVSPRRGSRPARLPAPSVAARNSDPSTSKGRVPTASDHELEIFTVWIKPLNGSWPTDSSLRLEAEIQIGSRQDRGVWARRRLDWERAGIVKRRKLEGKLKTQTSPETNQQEMTFALTLEGARWFRSVLRS